MVLTWPLVWQLNSVLPAGTDSIVHYWNNWWVGQALSQGESPYYTEMLFFPAGLSLVYHNFAWLHILVWLAFRPFFPPLAAYNLTLLSCASDIALGPRVASQSSAIGP